MPLKKIKLRYKSKLVSREVKSIAWKQAWLNPRPFDKNLLNVKTPPIIHKLGSAWSNLPTQGGQVIRIRAPHPKYMEAYNEYKRLRRYLRKKGPRMVEEQHKQIKELGLAQQKIMELFSKRYKGDGLD